MKRHQKYIVVAAIIGGIWAYLKVNQRSFESAQIQFIIDAFPWLLLMWLGCFCLGKLGFDLLLFNDYPQEIKVLEKDIQEAREDLARRGFVDKKSN